MTDYENAVESNYIGKLLTKITELEEALKMKDEKINELELALMSVEDWWVTQGKDLIDGAPAAIFRTRYVLANK